MLKKLRYITEFSFVWLIFRVFGILPIEWASACAGFIAEKIGPLLGISRVARRNIHIALPHLTEAETDIIIQKMFNNLGRVAGEFTHVSRMDEKAFNDRTEIEGAENFYKAHATGRPIILFSAHFGNWEMAPKTAYIKGFPLCLIYRRANNPYVDRMINHYRNRYQKDMFTKGFLGARKIVHAIEAGNNIGMLVDQKLNGGIPVPFFGQEAMTAPALAHFALRLNCTILPAKVVRKKGAMFKVVVYPPLSLNPTGDFKQDVYRIMSTVNQHMEQWIKDNPEQWFWVHKRFPKEMYNHEKIN